MAEVMVRHPQTLPHRASVAQALAAFADEHVHMLLLVDRRTLRGTVVREDLAGLHPTSGADVLDHARLDGRTVGPGCSTAAARRLLCERELRRLAVVGPGHELLGLLCLKRRGTGFCSDADVSARAADPH